MAGNFARFAFVVAGALVSLVGCGSPLPPVVIPAGAMAVPTVDNLAPVGLTDPPILCTLNAVLRPVSGALEGDQSDTAWPVWLRSIDGAQIYIRWPRGFSVRFEPGPTLLDETGSPFASAAGVLLSQVARDPAKGSKETPYTADGLIQGGLSGGWRCYVRYP